MSKIPKETLSKLNKILAKRFNRNLTETELEQAYNALMGFAFALVDLNSDLKTNNLKGVNNKVETQSLPFNYFLHN